MMPSLHQVGFDFQNDLRELRLNSDGKDCLFLFDIDGGREGGIDRGIDRGMDGWMGRWNSSMHMCCLSSVLDY